LMRRWLIGGGFAFMVVGVACSSGSSPPASGQGGTGAPGGGGTSAGGGGAGGQGGTCPPSQVTDLPGGINLNNECPYVGANTAGCGAGTFEYNCPDPLGFAVPPEGGCVHPTSGADTTLRWCCTTALCSHFPNRDARCDCHAANRYDYNCAPGATATATCAANTSGDFCCSFD
jgi:hypothetical protein